MANRKQTKPITSELKLTTWRGAVKKIWRAIEYLQTRCTDISERVSSVERAFGERFAEAFNRSSAIQSRIEMMDVGFTKFSGESKTEWQRLAKYIDEVNTETAATVDSMVTLHNRIDEVARQERLLPPVFFERCDGIANESMSQSKKIEQLKNEMVAVQEWLARLNQMHLNAVDEYRATDNITVARLNDLVSVVSILKNKIPETIVINGHTYRRER